MGWMEFVMGINEKKEARIKALNSPDIGGDDAIKKIANIDAIGSFIGVRRVRKITVHVCESKVPQFEKHMAKFFKKHGYRANISD